MELPELAVTRFFCIAPRPDFILVALKGYSELQVCICAGRRRCAGAGTNAEAQRRPEAVDHAACAQRGARLLGSFQRSMASGSGQRGSVDGAVRGWPLRTSDEEVKNIHRDSSCPDLHLDPIFGSCMPPNAEPGPVEVEGMDALAVLADAVESTPQSPPWNAQPKVIKQDPSRAVQQNRPSGKTDPDPDPETAMSAVSALAAIGSDVNAAADAVGPEVEFTARELQILTKELERCGAALAARAFAQDGPCDRAGHCQEFSNTAQIPMRRARHSQGHQTPRNPKLVDASLYAHFHCSH